MLMVCVSPRTWRDVHVCSITGFDYAQNVSIKKISTCVHTCTFITTPVTIPWSVQHKAPPYIDYTGTVPLRNKRPSHTQLIRVYTHTHTRILVYAYAHTQFFVIHCKTFLCLVLLRKTKEIAVREKLEKAAADRAVWNLHKTVDTVP